MEQLNPGQIKKNIKQLKQREEQYMYYLGQLAFHAGEQGRLEEPGMLEAYRTLKEIQAQIVHGEASLEQIRAAKEAAQGMRCPGCGGIASRDAAFCPKCGAGMIAPAAAAEQPAPAPAARLCSGCGVPLEEDAVFCGNCGVRSGVEEAGSAWQQPGLPVSGPAANQAAVPADAGREQAPGAGPAVPPGDEPAPPLEETHACPKCAAGLPDKDMPFCPRCGTKVRE